MPEPSRVIGGAQGSLSLRGAKRRSNLGIAASLRSSQSHYTDRGLPVVGKCWPQCIGTARADISANLCRPFRIATELVTPRPQAPCRELQRVFLGESDRSMDLMRDLRSDRGCIADARLGDARQELLLRRIALQQCL